MRAQRMALMLCQVGCPVILFLLLGCGGEDIELHSQCC